MIIKDDLLFPYRIITDDNQVTVEICTIDKDTKQYSDKWRSIGYYQTVGAALGSVVVKRFHSRDDLLTLEEYVRELKSLTEQFHLIIKKYNL